MTHLDGIDSAGTLGGDATVNDVISAIPVAPGDAGAGYVFGEVLAGSLAGSVFEDVNNDGVQDPGEVGVAGVDVTLTGTDDLGQRHRHHGADRRRRRLHVLGSAAIRRRRVHDHRDATCGSVGRDRHRRILGGDATVNDVVSAIPVGSGDAGTGYDFGELPPASLSGSVFEDLNNDGVQDPGEVGVAGVDVTLTGVDDLGNPVDVTVQTDVDGNYLFPDLRPSDATGYTITETQPAGLLDGIDTAGSLGGDATSERSDLGGRGRCG